jgi:hypothetical protein
MEKVAPAGIDRGAECAPRTRRRVARVLCREIPVLPEDASSLASRSGTAKDADGTMSGSRPASAVCRWCSARSRRGSGYRVQQVGDRNRSTNPLPSLASAVSGTAKMVMPASHQRWAATLRADARETPAATAASPLDDVLAVCRGGNERTQERNNEKTKAQNKRIGVSRRSGCVVGLPVAPTPSRSRQVFVPRFAPLRSPGFGPMRLRHDPYDEWFSGVSDALACRLSGFGAQAPPPLRSHARTYAYRGRAASLRSPCLAGRTATRKDERANGRKRAFVKTRIR